MFAHQAISRIWLLSIIMIMGYGLPVAGFENFESFKQRLEKNYYDGIEIDTDGRVHSINGRGIYPLNLDPLYAEKLQQLRTLELNDSGIRDRDLRQLRDLTMLTELDLSKTRVTDRGLTNLSALKNIEKIDLSQTEVTGIGLKYLANNKYLRNIGLENTSIQNYALYYLKDFEYLKYLDLSKTPISDRGLRYLKNAQNLKGLALSGTNITDAGLEIVSKIESIEGLNLHRTKITEKGIQNLLSLPNLRSLDVRDTEITAKDLLPLVSHRNLARLKFSNVRNEDFQYLEKFKTVERLDLELIGVSRDDYYRFLSQLKISRADWVGNFQPEHQRDEEMLHALKKRIDKLKGNKKSLDFTKPWTTLSESDLKKFEMIVKEHPNTLDYILHHHFKDWNLKTEELEIISKVNDLKTLILDRTYLGDSEVKILGKNAQLEHLSLRSDFYDTDFRTRVFLNTLSDKALETIEEMTNLEYLDLWGAKICGRGLEHLEQLTSMRYLNLGYTFVIGSRLRHLSKMKDLEVLNLQWTRIDDEDLDYITGLKKLTRINLQDTKLTDKAIERLEKFPALKWIDLSGTAVTQNGIKQLQKKLPDLEIIASHLYSDDPYVRSPERNDMF